MHSCLPFLQGSEEPGKTWKTWKYNHFLATQRKFWLFFKNLEKIRKIFSGHQFSDFLTIEQALSEYYYVLGSGEEGRGYIQVDTPEQGKRVKFSRKSAQVLYRWWSTHFKLVKKSGKKASICCSVQGKWHDYLWKPRETQEKCFELFCLNPVLHWLLENREW